MAIEPKKINFDVAIKSTNHTRSYALPPEVYTSDDNAVQFRFNILDVTPEEFVEGAAVSTIEITTRDGSIFQKVGDTALEGTTIVYDLKENEGNHAGLAKIQLVLKLGNKKFTSDEYEFKIINNIANAVPVEIYVQNWGTLTSQAEAYITQMAQDIEDFDVALETGILATNIAAKLQSLESTYAPEIVSMRAQLAESTKYSDLTPVVGYDFSPEFTFIMFMRNIGSTGYGTYVNYVNTQFDSEKIKNVVVGNVWNVSNSAVFTRQYASTTEIIDVVNAIRAKGIAVDTLRIYTNQLVTSDTYKTTFMTNYVTACKSDIDLCVTLGIAKIIFANEQPYFSWYDTYYSYYKDVIDYAHSKGLQIGSSCSYDELRQTDPVYLNDVDFIGVNWYPTLSAKGLSTTLDYAKDQLVETAKATYDLLVRIKTKYNKPMWITECGCTQHEFSLRNPANRTTDGTGTYPQNQYLYLSAILEMIGAMKINGTNPIARFMYFSLMDHADIYTPLNNEMAMDVIKNTYKKNKTVSRSNVFNTPNYSVVFADNSATVIDKNKTKQRTEILTSDSGLITLDKQYPRQSLKGFVYGKSTFSGNNVLSVSSPTLQIGTRNLISTSMIPSESKDYTILDTTSLMVSMGANSNTTFRSVRFGINDLTIGEKYTFSVKYKVLKPSILSRSSGVSVIVYNGGTAITAEEVGDGSLCTITFTATATSHTVRLSANRNRVDVQIYFYDLIFFLTSSSVDSSDNASVAFSGINLHEFDFIDLKNKTFYQKSAPINLVGTEVYTKSVNDGTYATFYTSLANTILDVYLSSNVYMGNAVMNPNGIWTIGRSDTITTNKNVYLYYYSGSSSRVYLTVSLSTIGMTSGNTDAEVLSAFTSYLVANPCVMVAKYANANVVKTQLNYNDVSVSGLIGNVISCPDTRLLLKMEN